jgi:hypothetical protein
MPTMMPRGELTHGFTIQTRHEPLRKVGEYAARSKLRSEARLAVIALNISCRSVAAKVLAYEFHDRGRKVRRGCCFQSREIASSKFTPIDIS